MVRPRPSLLVVTGILLFGFRAASAWDEPSGFRGVPWGANVETVKEKIPEVSCYESVACSATSGWEP